MCAELIGTSLISFAPNKDNVTVYDAQYLEAANSLSNSLDTETEPFERIKNMDYKVDHIQYSIVLGRQAISNYWHVLNPNLQPMYSALGYTINWTRCWTPVEPYLATVYFRFGMLLARENFHRFFMTR